MSPSCQPQIACPHTVDNVKPIDQVAGKKVNQVVIGSCTNGRLDDLAVAARILKGQKVATGTRMLIFPASAKIFRQALGKGYVGTFMQAGAVVMNSGCGPCLGIHEGALGDGEVALSTTNRNFKGRMGNPNSEVYLCSPAVAAASAITGVITSPTKEVTSRASRITHHVSRFTYSTLYPFNSFNSASHANRRIQSRRRRLDRRHLSRPLHGHCPAHRNAAVRLRGRGGLQRQAQGEAVPPGSVVVGGKNFGCGSSREQAVSCLKGHELIIVAKSFARIFLQNAINLGLRMIVCPGDRGRRRRRAGADSGRGGEQDQRQTVQGRADAQVTAGDH